MKERLDVLLVKRNLAESREKAKAVIMSGIVYVEGQKEDKAGTTFDESVNIEVRGHTVKYVSRGGLKLEKAMSHFGVMLEGKTCMGCGVIHRRLYRLHASKRRRKGLCRGCGTRSAGLEASERRAGSLYGKDEYPICDAG